MQFKDMMIYEDGKITAIEAYDTLIVIGGTIENKNEHEREGKIKIHEISPNVLFAVNDSSYFSSRRELELGVSSKILNITQIYIAISILCLRHS